MKSKNSKKPVLTAKKKAIKARERMVKKAPTKDQLLEENKNLFESNDQLRSENSWLGSLRDKFKKEVDYLRGELFIQKSANDDNAAHIRALMNQISEMKKKVEYQKGYIIALAMIVAFSIAIIIALSA